MAISLFSLATLPGLRMPALDALLRTHVDYPVANDVSDVPAAPATEVDSSVAPAQQTSN